MFPCRSATLAFIIKLARGASSRLPAKPTLPLTVSKIRFFWKPSTVPSIRMSPELLLRVISELRLIESELIAISPLEELIFPARVVCGAIKVSSPLSVRATSPLTAIEPGSRGTRTVVGSLREMLSMLTAPLPSERPIVTLRNPSWRLSISSAVKSRALDSPLLPIAISNSGLAGCNIRLPSLLTVPPRSISSAVRVKSCWFWATSAEPKESVPVPALKLPAELSPEISTSPLKLISPLSVATAPDSIVSAAIASNPAKASVTPTAPSKRIRPLPASKVRELLPSVVPPIVIAPLSVSIIASVPN